LLDQQVRAAHTELYAARVADRAALDRVFARAAAMRDSRWVEIGLAAIALLGGQLTLWGVTGPTGVFHGIEHAGLSPSQVWYAGIALPLLQFLGLRWLWRWVIWTVILLRLARLPLDTIATHPDRAAGLRFLAGPVTGFAVFELAFASTLASVWATQLLEHRVTLPSLLPTIIAFLVIAVAMACGPLLFFTPHLYRAQRKAFLLYHPFALDYVERFHAKWIDGRPDEEVLGTPDLQSFADLDNSYQIIEGTKIFVVGIRHLTELWLGAIIPCLPLLVAVIPIDQMFKKLGSMLFGGFV